MKLAGIIFATYIFSLGVIFSILTFNYYHIDKHTVAAKVQSLSNTNSSVNKSKDQNKELLTASRSIQTYVCEIVEVSNDKNKKRYQAVSKDGEKFDFNEDEIEGYIDKNNPKEHQQQLKIGDTIVITSLKDGKLSIQIDSE
ncbi:hypothetical protein [Gottfriedia luciferensis]|uniref:hypothetical protein n=1 Tax=Gottfriedia luciferensis TaxID=178774 RepID=UPI000B44A67E|nr:hypothetical protein [Gottfriedia luciferensis]